MIVSRKLKAIAAALLVTACLIPTAGCSVAKSEIEAPAIKPWTVEAIILPDALVSISEPDPDGVVLESVTTGVEVGLIDVRYRAAPKVADQWGPGSVYVIDEKTGSIYRDIPIAPILGPLLQKPRQEGQIAHVMIINRENGIGPGSVVSVTLGRYRRQHIVVN